MTDSPPDPASTTPEPPDPTAGSSPLPGCIILITIVVVFGGLATLYSVVATTQNKRLAAFTEDAPVVLAVTKPTPEQVQSTDAKIETIRLATEKNEMVRVLFTGDDLNTLISTEDLLADFRGMTLIRSVSEAGIEVAMSQPMRRGFLSKEPRYLNATLLVTPEVKANTVLFRVTDIQVPDREVPKAFIESYSALQFFKLDPKNEIFKPVLPKLDKIYLEGDQIVVETKVLPPR